MAAGGIAAVEIIARVAMILRQADEPRVRKPLVGYAMVLVAATLFGVNGSVAKIALSSGLSSLSPSG